MPHLVRAVDDARVQRDDLAGVHAPAHEQALARVRARGGGGEPRREPQARDERERDRLRSRGRPAIGRGGDRLGRERVARQRGEPDDLVRQVRAHLRLEIVVPEVLALLHHARHELGAVAVAPMERREHEQAMEVRLLLQPPRAAKVVARAAPAELLHEASKHREGRDGNAPPRDPRARSGVMRTTGCEGPRGIIT